MPVKTVTILVQAMTDRANAQVRATSAIFDELRSKSPVEMQVKLDKAQALAESRILAREMSATVRDVVKLQADGGDVGRIIRLMGGGGGRGGLLGLIGGAGGGGLGAAGIAGGGLTGAVGLAGVAMAALGIVPALVAAGAGVAAFGAGAIPTFTAVTGAISGVSAANAKFQEAAQNVDIAIRTSHADLVLYNAALKAMPPNLASAARLLGNQNVTWQALTTSQQNNVIALSQNKSALSSMLPAQRTALSQLLASKAVWDQLSPTQQKVAIGWQNLTTAYHNLVVAVAPDVLKIMNSGLKIAASLLPALLPLAKAGGDALAGLATRLAGFFKLTTTTTTLMSSGTGMHEIVTKTLTPFGEFMKTLTSLSGPTITAIGNGIGQIAVALGKLLLALTNKSAIRDMTVFFEILAGGITGLASFFAWATPRFNNSMREVANWGRTLRHWFDEASHNAQHMADDFRHWFGDLRQWLYDDFLLKISHFFSSMWDKIWADTISKAVHGIAAVESWFKGAPARFTSKLSRLGTDLENIGKAAFGLLLDGIKAGISPITGFLSGFAHGIVGIFKKVWGWFSPSSVMYEGGKALMQGLAGGIKDHAHLAQAAAAAAAGAATAGLAGGRNVTAWIRSAMRITGVPSSWFPLLQRLVAFESGGNPRAANTTPAGIAAGWPEGIAQVTIGTFAGSHLAGFNDIWNPVDNLIAGIRHILSAWGSIFNIPGLGAPGTYQGYRLGGLITEPILGVGPSGRMYGFHAGETVKPGHGGGDMSRVEALLDEQNDLLSQLIGVAAAAPVRTGAGIGVALSAGGRSAVYGALYP